VGVNRALVSVLSALFVVCAASSPADTSTAVARTTSPIAELWSEPTDLERQDLAVGRWGAGRAPDPRDRFTFLRHKTHGSSPGMTVHDTRGRVWHVKQGREAQPEVFMSHVLAAIGYHQPPVYFLPSFTVIDSSGAHDAPAGRFRLADPTIIPRGEWKWEDNPFVGSRPYQGLLVVLVLLNSADLKNSNNTMYEVGGRTWYVVRDLGTSLGAVGRFDPEPNDPGRFERRRFITGVKHGYVEFGDYHAVHADVVTHRVTVDDVRWACALLARLSERQWQDAFRGAGYPPEIGGRFVRRIREKIAEGRAVAGSPSRTLGPGMP